MDVPSIDWRAVLTKQGVKIPQTLDIDNLMQVRILAEEELPELHSRFSYSRVAVPTRGLELPPPDDMWAWARGRVGKNPAPSRNRTVG
ncbi:hypothetical protein [Streptomyces herbicida]|uniref:hypothetical protein n=1 Tax=Streptomyces herbicida TaxID=3065675 RepID=UPI00292D5F3D|nr:hypothetical protein [Streptomyces sp. NEAU-HV9]